MNHFILSAIKLICVGLMFSLVSCGSDTTPVISPSSTSPNANSPNTGAPADSVAPVVTMLGSSPYSFVVGATYVDAGATASDNVDGDVTANIVAVVFAMHESR